MQRQVTTEERNIGHGGFEVGNNVISAASFEMAKMEIIRSSRSTFFTFLPASLPFIGGEEDRDRGRGADNRICC